MTSCARPTAYASRKQTRMINADMHLLRNFNGLFIQK